MYRFIQPSADELETLFRDGHLALAVAVLQLSFADLQHPKQRHDAEKFLQSAWYENIVEMLGLHPAWLRKAVYHELNANS